MWEYKTETIDTTLSTKKSLKKQFDKVLEEKSNQGWDLVNFQVAGAFGSIGVMVFKRERRN